MFLGGRCQVILASLFTLDYYQGELWILGRYRRAMYTDFYLLKLLFSHQSKYIYMLNTLNICIRISMVGRPAYYSFSFMINSILIYIFFTFFFFLFFS